MKYDAFNVYLDGMEIDTIFTNKNVYTVEEMRQSLINHDGYHPNIEVRKVK